MSALYAAAAIVMAADAALVYGRILPGHAGLVWLRIHLLTIGMVTQALFGVLPTLVTNRAKGAGRDELAPRWDVWLTLNVGLLLLVAGIPLVSAALIIAGGLLVFTAAVLLIGSLRTLQSAVGSRNFYIAGLAYLLIGVTAGTGLFLGWARPLRMASPGEVHIHANILGFISLVFAGLLVDLYPRLYGRPLVSLTATRMIFWLLALGAFGLVAGPWVQPVYSLWFTGPGLALYMIATLWLLVSFALPLLRRRAALGPGPWHVITSYLWFLAPLLIAPIAITQLPDLPRASIEVNAPQILVFGWLLNFSSAFIPHLFRRVFAPKEPAALGGSWFSLVTVNAGGMLLWASIFVATYQAPLQGLAYGFWLAALVPIAADMWRTIGSGPARNSSA